MSRSIAHAIRDALAAGVEMIATDEYDLAGDFVRTAESMPAAPQPPR